MIGITNIIFGKDLVRIDYNVRGFAFVWVFKARLPTFAQQLNRIKNDEPITVCPHNANPFVVCS